MVLHHGEGFGYAGGYGAGVNAGEELRVDGGSRRGLRSDVDPRPCQGCQRIEHGFVVLVDERAEYEGDIFWAVAEGGDVFFEGVGAVGVVGCVEEVKANSL